MYFMKRIGIFATVMVAFLCTLVNGSAQAISSGEKVKVNGLIAKRDGGTLTVKTPRQGSIVVVVTEETKLKKHSGVIDLTPGLKIQVVGVGDDQNRVVARKLSFSGKDQQTAEAIEAGLVPTGEAVQTNKENIAANKEAISATQQQTAQQQVQLGEHQQQLQADQQQLQTHQQEIVAVEKRFSDLNEYDVQDSTTVYFHSGSKTLSEKDKAALLQLAQNSANLKGYVIQVKGYTDTRGNIALNQRLSMERAACVVAFLLQNGDAPLTQITGPGAMGETGPAAPNDTREGRAENRRVEVKVLVNRGLAQQSDDQALLDKLGQF